MIWVEKLKKIISFMPVLFLFFVIFFLYKNVLGFDYLWDDDLLIVHNVALINSELSWNLIARPVLDGSSYFRPFVFYSWFLEFKILGQSSYISHAINLFIFFCNTIIVYLLSKSIMNLEGKNFSLFPVLCAFIYAVHPIQVESVAWVSGRFDLLMTFFALSSCLIFIYKKNNNIESLKLDIMIAFLFLLSMMSKETGVLVPILLIVLNFCIDRKRNFLNSILFFVREDKNLSLLLLGSLSFYFILRFNSLGDIYHDEVTYSYYDKVVFSDYTPLFAIKEYMLQAVAPFFNLGPMKPTELFVVKDYFNLFSIFALTVFLFFIFYSAFFLRKISSLMLVCYLISISLVIFFIPILSGNNITQDRFMTLGICFIIISIVIFLSNIKSKNIKTLAFSLIFLWSIGLTLTTKSIIPFWKNELTLWSWVYQSHSEIPMIRNLYFYSLVKHGRNDELIEIINKEYINKGKALHIADQVIYARALLTKGNPESANYFKDASQVLPKFHENDINMDELVKATAEYHLNPMIFATIYDSLSIATLWFNNDPELALEYNKIAEFYLDEEEKYPLYFNRLSIFRVLGKTEDYENLKSNIKDINMYEKGENIQNYYNIVGRWCIYNNGGKCEEYNF